MPTLVASSEDTRIYECALLYPFPLGQKEEADLIKEVEGMFTDVGAKMVAKDAWGRRGLAYPIKGSTEAHVVIYYWEMDPSRLKEVDQQLRILKNVLRYMFVKPPKNYQILKYSELYQQWLKDRSSVDETRAKEKEQRLQEQVAKKAKRQVQRTEERKKEEVKAAPAMEEGAIEEKIDKLISDDSFEI